MVLSPNICERGLVWNDIYRSLGGLHRNPRETSSGSLYALAIERADGGFRSRLCNLLLYQPGSVLGGEGWGRADGLLFLLLPVGPLRFFF